MKKFFFILLALGIFSSHSFASTIVYFFKDGERVHLMSSGEKEKNTYSKMTREEHAKELKEKCDLISGELIQNMRCHHSSDNESRPDLCFQNCAFKSDH